MLHTAGIWQSTEQRCKRARSDVFVDEVCETIERLIEGGRALTEQRTQNRSVLEYAVRIQGTEDLVAGFLFAHARRFLADHERQLTLEVDIGCALRKDDIRAVGNQAGGKFGENDGLGHIERLAARRCEAAEEKITLLARTDALTGLADRATFTERLSQAFAAAYRGANPFAIHYLDLDKFKPVNDTFGHPALHEP
jgi:predicted signal transduction protein with EAL and GGDEF domain